MKKGKRKPKASKANDTIDEMRLLGFSDYESRIYIQLLKSSPATAYEISKLAGVPRPNTYSALNSLAEQRAVLPVSENPVRYIAAKPDDLFPAISRQTSLLCENLENELADLSKDEESQYVWIARGESEVRQKIDELIESSEHTIWVKASEEVLNQHAAKFREAAGRGVSIHFILFGTNADAFRFSKNCFVYIHEGSGVRMGTADNLFTLTIDHREMLTASDKDGYLAAFTQNGPVVTMAQSLLRHDYFMAEIFAKFDKQLTKEFGPHLKKLRMATYTDEQIKTFKKRVDL